MDTQVHAILLISKGNNLVDPLGPKPVEWEAQGKAKDCPWINWQMVGSMIWSVGYPPTTWDRVAVVQS